MFSCLYFSCLYTEEVTMDGQPLLDLIQEGDRGLMMAANQFSWGFHVRFSTCAHPWITQYILRYLQHGVPAICPPSRKRGNTPGKEDQNLPTNDVGKRTFPR